MPPSRCLAGAQMGILRDVTYGSSTLLDPYLAGKRDGLTSGLSCGGGVDELCMRGWRVSGALGSETPER